MDTTKKQLSLPPSSGGSSGDQLHQQDQAPEGVDSAAPSPKQAQVPQQERSERETNMNKRKLSEESCPEKRRRTEAGAAIVPAEDLIEQGQSGSVTESTESALSGEGASDELDSNGTASDEAESEETPTDEAESDEAESDEAESDGAESDEAESDEAESDGAESSGAESDETESEETPTDEAESEAESDEANAEEADTDEDEPDEAEPDEVDAGEPDEADAGEAGSTSARCDGGDRCQCGTIEHWVSTGMWPKRFLAAPLSKLGITFRPLSGYSSETATSYSRGTLMAGWEEEDVLEQAGIILDDEKGGKLLSQASKEFVEEMHALKADYEDPAYSPFPLHSFTAFSFQIRPRNASRMFRDVCSMLVPSAELLYLGGQDHLEHVVEEVLTPWRPWTKPDKLPGPIPMPYLAVGISGSGFNSEEIAKLDAYSAKGRPTLFTDEMYFPFLICEALVKESRFGQTDTRAARSGSMAVNAIVQLCRALGDDEASKLSGQVLVFSVSQDYGWVTVYGHYAIIKGAKITFYRSHVDIFFLTAAPAAKNSKNTPDFVRKIYDDFYPKHLARIKEILGKMTSPKAPSTASTIASEMTRPLQLDFETKSSAQPVIIPNAPNAFASMTQDVKHAVSLIEVLVGKYRGERDWEKKSRRELMERDQKVEEKLDQERDEQIEKLQKQVSELKELMERQEEQETKGQEKLPTDGEALNRH
ncbi:hypothetical protein AYO22_11689 [Fonsecaea multimorphosa]|nr:hypothetical protein AYO22_11689 [Fonsecaea multimorphosa]